MKIAVTGVGGFVGQHLVRELASHDIEVIGIAHHSDITTEIDGLMSECQRVDLTKEWPEITEVDSVIHLAGLAAVGPSFDNPQNYIEANSAMMTNLGEHYLKHEGKKPRLVIISSGAIYEVDQKMPLNEESDIAFRSPYAVSKVLIENQAAYYLNRGLDCIIMRPFNHIGPGQKSGFLVPDLYESLKSTKQTGVLKIGNLKTKRDYTDVRDVVHAYRLVASQKSLKSKVYNVCSGKSVAGEKILSQLQKLMGLENLKIEIDKSRFRPSDAKEIIGDSSRLQTDVGWKPNISLEQTL
jgi:GDP-4-dehydro-6-deoxy-D-mannose reductase